MAGPWDEYATTPSPQEESAAAESMAQARGPWNDYQTPTARPSRPPWMDYQTPPAPTPNAVAPPQPPISPERAAYPTTDDKVDILSFPSMPRALLETGKGITRGLKDALVGQTLAGIGGWTQAMTPGAIAGFSEGVVAPAPELWGVQPVPEEKNPFITGGKAVLEAGTGEGGILEPSKTNMGPIAKYLFQDLPAGLGSMFGYMSTGLLGAGPALLTTGIGGVGQQMQDIWQTSKKKTDKGEPAITVNENLPAAIAGTTVGLTEYIDTVLPKLGMIGKIAGIASPIARGAAKMVVRGATEFGQEYGQQVLQNLIALGFYEPGRDPTEDAFYSGLVGFGAGAVGSPLISKLERGGRDRVASDQDIINAFGGPEQGRPQPAESPPTGPGGPPPPPGGPAPAPPTTSTSTGFDIPFAPPEAEGGAVEPGVPPVGRPKADISGMPTSGPQTPKPAVSVKVEGAEVGELPAPPPGKDPAGGKVLVVDAGWGLELRKSGGKWHLVDPTEGATGVSLARANTFDGIAAIANEYGKTGRLSTSPTAVGVVPTPETEAPSNVVPMTPPGGPKKLYVSETGANFPDAQAIRAAFDYLTIQKKMGSAEIKKLREEKFDGDVVRAANSLGFTAFRPVDVEVSKKGKPQPTGTITAPVETALPPNTLPKATVEFMAKNTGKGPISITGNIPGVTVKGVALPTDGPPAGKGPIIDIEPTQKQAFFSGGKPTGTSGTVEASTATNQEAVDKILSHSLYGDLDKSPFITMKELLQNAYDAVRNLVGGKTGQIGNIKIVVDPTKRTIYMWDDGHGMTTETLSTKFLEVGGSKKEGKATGGFGIAKLITLYANQSLRVVTMRDGVVSRMATTGEALTASRNKTGPAPKVDFGPPTAQDNALFPKGHGTMVEVQIPENYEKSDGTIARIALPSMSHASYDALTNSPLLSNVNVSFNGKPIPNMGSTFPVDKYQPLMTIKFPWGQARVFYSKDEIESKKYENNLTVLGNGLFQFVRGLKANPARYESSNIPRDMYFDIEPREGVKPGDVHYPFMPNRQGFSPAVVGDMTKVLNHVSAFFRFAEYSQTSGNFGSMAYIDPLPSGGHMQSPPQLIVPKKPSQTPIDLIKPGDRIEVNADGQLTVNGKQLPPIDLRELDKMTPDFKSLKVNQDEIDPKRVILHDNTNVNVSDVQKAGVSDLALEKFGKRYLALMHDLGTAFMQIRDAMARDKRFPRWSDIGSVGVGISFDKEYRGVHTLAPFQAMFVNPATPEHNDDPVLAGLDMVYTMIHEASHHKIWNHNETFPPELQAIVASLDSLEGFEFYELKNRVVETVARNWDIFKYINGFFSGAYDVQPRGTTFKDPGSQQTRDGGGLGARAQAGDQGLVAGVGQPSGARALVAQQSVLGSRAYLTVTEGRSSNPASERDANTRNLQQLDPELVAAPVQSELASTKQAVNTAAGGGGQGGGGGSPGTPNSSGTGAVAQLGAHADKFNAMMKWAWGKDRLADKNPRAIPLLHYNEIDRVRRLMTNRVMDTALRVSKMWRSLGKQSENLTAFLDDLTNMVYRTPQEVQKRVRRHPTQQEFAALVQKHKLSRAALDVYSRQKALFKLFLDMITDNAIKKASKYITDPVVLTQRIGEIHARQAALEEVPFFPFMRFGEHYVVVKDPTGKTVFFQTYERQGLRSAESVQMAALAKIKATTPAGWVAKPGILPITAAPFLGLPPQLLDSIATELGLTTLQQEALKDLRYQYSPAASFAHHWQNKNYTPGYSNDFHRAFTRYFFHGSRYLANAHYAEEMREQIVAMRNVGGNKAEAIANYLEDHFQNNIIDAKGDFGKFKGAIFLWVFGYSPVGAWINLSQIPVISYPFMAAKFGGIGIGDARATKALVKAMVDYTNFRKKGYYDNQTDFFLRALDYGIKSGRISEAMASQLAGLAQGNNLLGTGRTKVERGFQRFMEGAAFLFEMAEQYNRRVTYAATLDLAMKHPGSLAERAALNFFSNEYQDLLAKGTNPREAAAIVTACYVTEQTQFVYARENRPRFMRGPLAGTIFVFKQYLLNVLQLMGANKGDVMPRYLLIMFALAGLRGLPGADDALDIAQILGRWLFGKDFNVKLALRKLIIDVSNETIPPDIVLHGLSRKGFGIPALMDLMGEHPGRGLGGAVDTPGTRKLYERWAAELKAKGAPSVASYEEFRKQHSQNIPFPSVDLSRSLGMGRLAGVDIGKFFDPDADVNAAIAGTAQQASGAVFSVAFNLYKALQDDQTPATDLKRWEKAMPRALAGLSRAYRAYYEGRERTRGGPNAGATVVKYDSRDPEQAAELFALAAGFMPTRLSAQWDAIAAQQEVIAKFKFERQLLEGQMFEAVAGRNEDERERVRKAIVEFNKNLPDWARSEALTNEQIRQSVEARARAKALKEAGVPAQRIHVPVARHVQDLFPESVVDVRPITAP